MTQEEFNDYIKNHKVEKIVAGECGGHVIHFDNGHWIDVGADYDGVAYSYHYPGEILPDTKQFLKDYIAILPDQIDKLELIYGNSNTDLLL